MLFSTFSALRWMKKYLRYVDYIGAAQLYLRDNFLLRDPIKADHFKPRVLGHWGTVPGLNLIYANLNYLVAKHGCSMLMITGPGHGAPAILANVFAEGTLGHFYKNYPADGKGMGRLIHDFSWPHTKFPSHVTPTVPGSILEGGELGYSLSTAYGAVMDNPDLIVAAVVGDGEAETGPTATAWHSNKFLNPKTSGAVLPIVHINGYKISNPTLYGTMSDEELTHLFKGYGYEPIIVAGSGLERKMIRAMEAAYQRIRAVQKKARHGGKDSAVFKPKWPVILLRSLKGWKGIHSFHGQLIEGTFHAHGVPIGHPHDTKDERDAVLKWLRSYKIQELVENNGDPKPELFRYVPKGKLRIGMNRHAFGGDIYKPLKLPIPSKYALKFKERGSVEASSMGVGAPYLRDVFKLNKDNFRLMCPDELESNKLSAVFQQTQRAYMWPIQKKDEHLSPDGRVMEMLSEHTLQGWLQGYLLTGRHGMFVSYEAFTTIISSMVDQHAKFLKQSFRVPWRKPIGSAIYLLTSLGWRQEHNGFSHQNPGFVSNILQKHGEFCQVYYPSDANSLLAAFEETLLRKNAICVIVAGKTNLPQWLSLNEARAQAKNGIGIWDWVGGTSASRNPDVVLASAGDYITTEALFGAKLCRELVPQLNIRYVNVSEFTSLCLGDFCPCRGRHNCLNKTSFYHYFTADKPVVFNYHGYVNDVEQILWPLTDPNRFSIHGYREEGSTTTPFDMQIVNGVSRYHVAMEILEQAAKRDRSLARKKPQLMRQLNQKIRSHQDYIAKHGDDPKEVKAERWV